ncbi:hypothetical protein BKA64DRAFT_228797 [Cadophora sp. MPI-SDFR-AT-0126]|nr:hypothetical protein BKA64DRAFT_228797 [Leotiomycetes sp. MPI-SDFR-AT-0126]
MVLLFRTNFFRPLRHAVLPRSGNFLQFSTLFELFAQVNASVTRHVPQMPCKLSAGDPRICSRSSIYLVTHQPSSETLPL